MSQSSTLEVKMTVTNEPIKRKSVIITGGSSGIGLAIAEYLVSLPFHFVTILDINASTSAGVLKKLSSQYPNAQVSFKQCDISSWASQASVFAEIYHEVGIIDVVIANAGVSEKGNFLEEVDEPREPVLTTVDVNLRGTLHSVNLAVHYMRKNAVSGGSRGSILCTASNAGLYPFHVAPIYATSKHAVVGAVRSLGKPLQMEAIQINALAPAVIATGLADKNLFGSMILTPVSTAVDAVKAIMEDPKITGVIAEVSGEKVTFRSPPEFVDADTKKNLNTFWSLGYA